MSWNIPPAYFTFSIPFQLYCSTAFTNSGGSWDISSLSSNHACGTCCCSFPGTNSTDITEHTHGNAPGYELHIKRNKDGVKDLFSYPYLPVQAIESSAKTVPSLLDDKTVCETVCHSPDQEATRKVPRWTSQTWIQLLYQGRRGKTHLYLLLWGFTCLHFSSLTGRKTAEKFLHPSSPPPPPRPFTLELGWECGSGWCKMRPPSPLQLRKHKLSRSSGHLLPEKVTAEWARFTIAALATEQVPFCILIFNLLQLMSFLFFPIMKN